MYSGPYQNETGRDAIWDHPYIIDADNQDRYPLVNPWMPTLHGIDVSHHQGEINWTKVYGGGYRFAFVKATGATDFKDPKFETNMKQGRKAGIVVGAYHFAYPEYNDPKDEGQFFINVARDYLKGGYLRPALDIEDDKKHNSYPYRLGKEKLSNWIHTWMETVKNETGIEPIIYVNSNYASKYLNTSVAKYDLWIAHWTYNSSASPNTGIWDSWDFWQWSNESSYAPLGYVPGVSGNVDLDVFNGSMPKLYNSFVIQSDIGITEIAPSKTIIGQGFNLPINTTIVNYGDPIETFNVTIYANETLITSQTITLTSGNSTTVTFTWNTTGVAKGNYTIKAKATSLPGETDTTDNTFVYGIVKVTIPGDITGDFKVDILDFPILMLAYGSRPGNWNWPPNADINCDQVVNYLDRFIL